MSPHPGLVQAYFELTKPRISTLLIIVAIGAFLIATPESQDWWGLVKTFVAVSTLSAGIFALNHFMERGHDRLMVRTRDRPLPSGRLKEREVLIFGLSLTFFGILFSALFANLLTGALALFVAASYLLVYTPLKYRTAWHTALGAFPGAVPPLAGWAVATGRLDPDAWILGGILFFWQFPHFISIEMIYKDDYERAGVRVLPVVDKRGGKVAFEVISTLLLLIVVSLLPFATGLGGLLYTIGAGLSGLAFLAAGVAAVATRQKKHAKLLLRASVFYLPLLFLLLFLDIFGRGLF